MEYQPSIIEQKWQNYWTEKKTFKTDIDQQKPKFYILDMFPYPSGAGLHVGHPLGYIASDIYTRFKRLKGFNVLHPMGYDAFGLPAEQYAIQTGQHPAITTEKNIKRYREQLDKIGLSFDWSREVRTCDPDYYHWTQWAFIQMFNHYYDYQTHRAEPISKLIDAFVQNGNEKIEAATSQKEFFTASKWRAMSEEEQQNVLLCYRLVYLADTMVNWCPALGTVLANDEVKEGFSVRGGHPVEQKLMKQWCLRITAYAERLLRDLDSLLWSDSLKEMQRNWIGRSEGAEVRFPLKDRDDALEIFTTRPDTIYGVTFMVLAPEHPLVGELTTPGQQAEVDSYILEVKKKTERERMADTHISGVFTGSYALHPLTDKPIPIWLSDYVLMGYGSGAIMAVPAHDSRDYRFAKTFSLPIIEVVSGGDISEQSYDAKDGVLVNSELINGLNVKEAITKMLGIIKEKKLGERKVNFRLRDAIFSRQRYWGEPFPVYYKKGLPYVLKESELPLHLPAVDSYLPTETGEPPLARAHNWCTKEGHPLEHSTMPGFAGSSAYFLRYMDPHNKKELVSSEANNYWQDVDLYIGGSEHATGHLIYSRFWNKFLFDIGLICKDEPFKKLFNQGMIQGRSNFVYRIQGGNQFVSLGLKDQYKVTPIHVDVGIVKNDILDLKAFKESRAEYQNAEFILEEGQYRCGVAIEKMSKSFYNVVNPDEVIKQYGADAFRLYEMFLGPLDQSKPWITNGLEGTSRFLGKFWRLFYSEKGSWVVNQEEATTEELKILHKTIKKVEEDISQFSFNTSVSAFMVCVNELSRLNCHKQSILEPLTVTLSSFAPHLCEELWEKLGHMESISFADYPTYDEKYLIESTYSYPVSFNGKTRFLEELPLDWDSKRIEEHILKLENTTRWLQGKSIKKVIIVPQKIINIVC